MSSAPTSDVAIYPVALGEISYKMFLPNAEKDHIQRSIASSGRPYEASLLEAVNEWLPDNAHILDVGGNIGNHTLFWAKAGHRVDYFEPTPDLVEIATRNFEVNDVAGQVVIHQIAVGDTQGKAHLENDDPNNVGGTRAVLDPSGTIEVQKLDNLELRGIDLVKIDVEGMEAEVLNGALQLIEKENPILVIETLDVNSLKAVGSILSPLEYVIWDTFNASPTQLFVPLSKLTNEKLVDLSIKSAEKNFEFTNKMKAVRSDLLNANSKYRTAIENIEKLKKQIASFGDSKNHALNDAEVLRLTGELRAAQEKFRHSHEEMRGLRVEIERQLSARDQIRAVLDSVLSTHRDLYADTKLADAKRIELSDENEKLRGDLQTALSQLQVSQSELFKVQGELEREVAYHAETINKLDSTNESMVALKNELQYARQSIAQMREQNDSSRAAIFAKLDRLGQICSIFDESDQFDDAALADIEKVGNRVETVIAAFTDLEVRLSESELTNLDLESQLQRAAEEVENRTQEFEALQVQFHDAVEKVDLHTKDNADLTAQLQDALDLLKGKEESQEQLKKQPVEHSSKIAELEGQLKEGTSSTSEKEKVQSRGAASEVEFADNSIENESVDQAQAKMVMEVIADIANFRGIQPDNAISQVQDILTGVLTEEQLKLSRMIDDLNLKNQVQAAQLEALEYKLSIAESEAAELRMKLADLRGGLTYRTGQVIGKTVKNPKSIVHLPSEIRSIIRTWKLRKESQRALVPGQGEKSIPLAIARQEEQTVKSGMAPSPLPNEAQVEAKSFSTNSELDQLVIKPKNDIKVACILDEFSYACFSPEGEFLQLTPQHWRQELEEFKPDLLFVESAWRGKDNLWTNTVAKCGAEISGILDWCKKAGTPTAFWNKEDPVHFSSFLTLASHFDAVFTTDMNCVPRYKKQLGHDQVFFLPFAAQTRIHNPIEKFARKDAFSFAGSYYLRYPERTAALESFAQELTKTKPLIIFDRNFGASDENYKFPSIYNQFIVGRLEPQEIDYAYKGFTAAINLNSVRVSQSMLARRVFELVASNTLVVSNYSPAIKTIFGKSVIASDDGAGAFQILQSIHAIPDGERKIRAQALRKVLREHTYQDRFEFILQCVGKPISNAEPILGIATVVENNDELDDVLSDISKQGIQPKKITVISDGIESKHSDSRITFTTKSAAAKLSLAELCEGVTHLAFFHPADQYGPNYLEDLALTFKYVDVPVVGKAQHNVSSDSAFAYLTEYSSTNRLPVRSSMFSIEEIGRASANFIVENYEKATSAPGVPLFVIDSFEYRFEGKKSKDLDNGISTEIVDPGFALAELQSASKVTNETDSKEIPTLNLTEIRDHFTAEPKDIEISKSSSGLKVSSTVEHGKHQYLYADGILPMRSLPWKSDGVMYVDASPGLDLMMVLLFLDKKKERIGHTMAKLNVNNRFPIPDEAKYVRFGFRVSGSGSAVINKIVPGNYVEPAVVLKTKAKHLVLTNIYPSYDNLYRNGFVHSRVKSYIEAGLDVEVVCVEDTPQTRFREFDGVSVIHTSPAELELMIANNNVETALVHFLDPAMWGVVSKPELGIRTRIWVHGSEVQPWWRREYNATNVKQLADMKAASAKRMKFWKSVFTDLPDHVEFIFVSQYFADEVMEDVGLRLSENKYHIIHNPIDGSVFDYVPKSEDQRLKILSIRPYASRKYANDLSVKAVLDLQDEPYFSKLHFTFVGDGPMFDEILDPVKNFDNVTCQRGFLKHAEIAKMHKEFGILMTPTRMDAQGVSRDEGMSSGLVPLTTAVAAVPEFVDEETGFLAPLDDYKGLANGIRELFNDPERFLEMSKKAADRVRKQSGKNVILEKELSVIQGAISKLGS